MVAAALTWAVSVSQVKGGENLLSDGGMEECIEGSSPTLPQGWQAIGTLDFESDSVDFKSGARSVKVRTPDVATALASGYIDVTPNTKYEVEASILARGEKQSVRPFVGLRLVGNRQTKYPAGEGSYLLTWESHEDEIGFVAKTARFITDSETTRVRVYLVTRAKPVGFVNIDDVILKEANPE